MDNILHAVSYIIGLGCGSAAVTFGAYIGILAASTFYGPLKIIVNRGDLKVIVTHTPDDAQGEKT